MNFNVGKLVIFIVFLLALLSTVRADNLNNKSIYIINRIYQSVVDCRFRQPILVKYTITDKAFIKNIKRRPLFKSESRLPKNCQLAYSDYKKQYLYDRGHLCFDAAFDYNFQILQETYYYSNIVLQHRSLNRGLWRVIENFVLVYLKKQLNRSRQKRLTKAVVMDLVLFDKKTKRQTTNVTKPIGFIKLIKYCNKNSSCYFPRISDFQSFKKISKINKNLFCFAIVNEKPKSSDSLSSVECHSKRNRLFKIVLVKKSRYNINEIVYYYNKFTRGR